MSKTFDMTIRTPADQIPTILEVLKGSARLVSISSSPDSDPPAPRVSVRRNHAYSNGADSKCISIAELLSRELADGNAHTSHEFRRLMKKYHLKPQSFTGAMSTLVREGKAKFISRGVYQKV